MNPLLSLPNPATLNARELQSRIRTLMRNLSATRKKKKKFMSLTQRRSSGHPKLQRAFQRRSSSLSCRRSLSLPSTKVAKPHRKLPAELRNKIYKLALSDEGGVFIISKTRGYRRVAQRCVEKECEPQFSGRRYWRHNRNSNNEDNETEGRRSFVPNLLAVSKEVRAEAASFLYSQPICVADNYTLLSFLNQIGPEYSSLLRDITIREWCAGRAHRSINFPAMTLLAYASDLRRLNIACAVGYFYSYSWRTGGSKPVGHRVARKIFRDCYPWLEAVGRAKGKLDAAVEVLEISDANFTQGFSRVNNSAESMSVEEHKSMFHGELRKLLKA